VIIIVCIGELGARDVKYFSDLADTTPTVLWSTELLIILNTLENQSVNRYLFDVRMKWGEWLVMTSLVPKKIMEKNRKPLSHPKSVKSVSWVCWMGRNHHHCHCRIVLMDHWTAPWPDLSQISIQLTAEWHWHLLKQGWARCDKDGPGVESSLPMVSCLHGYSQSGVGQYLLELLGPSVQCYWIGTCNTFGDIGCRWLLASVISGAPLR